MMPIDVHTSIGGVPYREVPHPEPAILARVLARENVGGAWVGDLPATFAEDPHASHDALFAALGPFPELRPTPTIHPGRREWERAFDVAAAHGAVAVRAHPTQWRLEPAGAEMRALAERCAASGLALQLFAHLDGAEEGRFRAEPAEAIAAVVGASASLRVVVLGADRALISAVRGALASAHDGRVWWDIARIAGPPADDLAALLRVHGGSQFVYGSGWPLLLTQVPRANLELLPADVAGVALADADAVGAPRVAS